jgi:putative tricarboxylic transport membrane protein
MVMRKLDISSSLFWLAFALFTGGTGLRLGIGTLHQPGPGFFPFGGSLIITVSALITLFQALREKAEVAAVGGEKVGKDWKKVILLLLSCFAYALVVETIGFSLCTFLLFLFFLRVVAPAPWGRALLVSACVAVASHLLFNVGLDAGLPKGFLGF